MTEYVLVPREPTEQTAPPSPVVGEPVKYSARNSFLSLTDQSNWDHEMTGDFYRGYAEAMEAVHERVMDFWPELSATDLPLSPSERDALVKAEAEIEGVLVAAGKSAIRVREGGGPENIYASLAVTVSALVAEITKLRRMGEEQQNSLINLGSVGAQLEQERDALEKALIDHNDLLRSAAAIANRDGDATNWAAFRDNPLRILGVHQSTTNNARAALAARAAT